MRIVRRVLNRCADVFFAGESFDRAWVKRLNGKAICFCYHRVDDPKNHAFLTETGYRAIRPEQLTADLRFLKQKGFDFITFADWREKGALDPDRPYAIVSFDDCFKGNYGNGLNVLHDAGVRAVFFQVSAMVDSGELLWEQLAFWHCHDASRARRFAELAHAVIPGDTEVTTRSGLDLAFYMVECLPYDKTQRIMRAVRERLSSAEERRLAEIYPLRADLVQARRAGHEIGSHGHLHYKRVNVSAELFEQDLVQSIATLRSITGQTPHSYAYPHGNFVEGDAAICSKYFKHVATTRRGAITSDTDPMQVPRSCWGGPAQNAWRRKRWLLTGGP